MRNPVGFFSKLRGMLGRLDQSQVDGINFLVESMEDDPAMSLMQFKGYALATAWHETNRTMQPIREYGSDAYLDKYDTGELAAALGNTPEDDDDGILYCGRGYVQITGADNYRRFGKILNLPLLEQPDLALKPEVAYQILSIGMTAGIFTGKRLSQYFGMGIENPIGARRVVNRLDKAEKIAAYYAIFMLALRAGESLSDA